MEDYWIGALRGEVDRVDDGDSPKKANMFELEHTHTSND
jgi:hypothetical protein